MQRNISQKSLLLAALAATALAQQATTTQAATINKSSLYGATLEYVNAAKLYETTSPTPSTSEKQSPETKKMVSVGDAKVEAKLRVGGKSLTVAGQSSFHLQADEANLAEGLVGVHALNIALREIPQEILTYAGRSDKSGSLGFVVKAGQQLQYNAKTQTLEGTLAGFISADYMAQFAEPLGDSARDHNRAPRQAAEIKVQLTLSKPFEAHGDKPAQQEGEMRFELVADESRDISAYPLQLEAQLIYRIDTVISFWFEAAQNLCVQPVRIGKFVWEWPYISVDYTGAGLAFGQPEANTQWRKADVTFTWRPWKNVFKYEFFTFSTSEAADLLDEVNDDDCVEVYFVNGDTGMHNNWGGGATFWSGESYTKIISSDANATNGIDKVHLAHELGHALDLPHPTNFNASSTNTLMCPSGFMNDNPARNSLENKNNLSNPLLTFTLKTIGPGPDCTNSADCGACP